MYFQKCVWQERRANSMWCAVFTARCYASAVLAMALCPSVCPIVHVSTFSGITGWLLLSHTTWSEQCSHFVIHILKLLHVIGHMLHLMIIIYHHSYGTTLHLSLPTICSGIAHLYWWHKQWSLSTIIVPAYIYSNIPRCYYFSSIFAHRPEVHRSARSAVWPFAHYTVQWLRLRSHCTVAMLADLQQLRDTFRLSFDCIVVF